jgi:hypothetical protein
MGQEIPQVKAEELPAFNLNRNECFDGGSLWGYMNGGADIYLEYGFEILRVEEFANKEEAIKMELFKMDDPVSAFGIYSIKTFRCEQSNVITTTDCLNQFQFQFFFGDYYLQLINESGSPEARQTMIAIAKTLHDKIDSREFLLPITYLTDSLKLSLSDIKMVKGPLGVHNKTNYLEDYLDGLEDYQIYYAKKRLEGQKVNYYEIVFDDLKMKSKFLENNDNHNLNIIWEDDSKILIKHLP